MARKRIGRQAKAQASLPRGSAKTSKTRPRASASSRRASSPRTSRAMPRRSTLKKIVSALKSGAASLAREAGRRGRASSASAPARTAPPFKPITKVSVVRKPARGPSVRASRPGSAAKQQASTLRPSALDPERLRQAGSAPATVRHGGSGQDREAIASTAGARTASLEEQFSIPTGYGDDRIVAMVKDPWWIFAYWEIQPSTERAARSHILPHEVVGLQSILRVHDVTGIEYPACSSHRSFDIGLSGLATNWYIQTNAPGREFIIEIGLLTHTGRFLMLVRSNRVATPRFGPSDVIDERWATTDDAYWKLFSRTAGVGIGSSPTAWAHFLSQQVSSGNWSSYGLTGPGKAASMIRGFWCRVDTDLVLHGLTEPKASVMIQGHPVTVRKDGSFSLRVALPEGTQSITIEVTSADGRHSKTITPIVSLAGTGSSGPDPRLDRSQASWPKLEPRDGDRGSA